MEILNVTYVVKMAFLGEFIYLVTIGSSFLFVKKVVTYLCFVVLIHFYNVLSAPAFLECHSAPAPC